jgi:hypothetical protein
MPQSRGLFSERQVSMISECDSVPKGRQVIATGASPWTAVEKKDREVRKGRHKPRETGRRRPFGT